MKLRIASLLLGLVSLCASEATAQQETFELVPYVGAYLPSGDLARGTLTDGSGGTTAISLDQKSGAALGSRVVAWWSRVLGWEVSFSYVASDVEVRVDEGSGEQNICGPDLDCSGNVWAMSSRILARYSPGPEARWYVFGAAGLAVVGHLGDVWERGEATTDLGGVLGIGGVLELSKRFALRLDIEDYLYTYKPKIEADPELGTLDGKARSQNDFMISAGLVVRLFGR